jgi:hypothetical protein
MLAAAALLALAAPAAAHHAHRSACQKLRGRGKDRAPARNVKLVVQHNRDFGVDVLGCVLPRGHVYWLASTDNSYDTAGESVAIRQVAGAFVLLESEAGDQYEDATELDVWNLRSGRHRAVAGYSVPETLPGSPEGTRALAAFIDRHGRAIVEGQDVAHLDAGVTIYAISSTGTWTDLDSGPADQLPAASLKLTGSTASWLHAGVQHTAQLTG